MSVKSILENSAAQQAARVAILVLIGLLSAGAMGLAKDVFYTKDEVDQKINDVRSFTEIERGHMMEIQRIQNKNIIKKLDEIGADVKKLEERAR